MSSCYPKAFHQCRGLVDGIGLKPDQPVAQDRNHDGQKASAEGIGARRDAGPAEKIPPNPR
jgi:hypothetical protein